MLKVRNPNAPGERQTRQILLPLDFAVSMTIEETRLVFEAGLRKISLRRRPRSNPKFARSAQRQDQRYEAVFPACRSLISYNAESPKNARGFRAGSRKLFGEGDGPHPFPELTGGCQSRRKARQCPLGGPHDDRSWELRVPCGPPRFWQRSSKKRRFAPAIPLRALVTPLALIAQTCRLVWSAMVAGRVCLIPGLGSTSCLHNHCHGSFYICNCLISLTSGRGEIGRRKGLKIPRPQGCAGSTPAVRTNKSMTYGENEPRPRKHSNSRQPLAPFWPASRQRGSASKTEGP
jgi:hypothetical protein